MPGSPKNTPQAPPPPQLTGPPVPSPQTLLPQDNPNNMKEDRIQFLHNVHFPEQRPIRADWPILPPHHPPPPGLQGPSTPQPPQSTQGQPPQQQPQQLPPAMIENPNRQIEWCNPLIDTSGVDAATKLMEFLILANQQNSQPQLIGEILYIYLNLYYIILDLVV